MPKHTGTYDYSKFSVPDLKTHKTELEHLPYDPRMQEAFAAFKQEQRNEKRRDERHLDGRELTDKLVEAECTRNRPLALEDQAERRLGNERLYAAIRKLPPASRRRIMLHYFHGLTHEEIAYVEGVSQPAITKSINISLKKLKKLLGNGL